MDRAPSMVEVGEITTSPDEREARLTLFENQQRIGTCAIIEMKLQKSSSECTLVAWSANGCGMLGIRASLSRESLQSQNPPPPGLWELSVAVEIPSGISRVGEWEGRFHSFHSPEVQHLRPGPYRGCTCGKGLRRHSVDVEVAAPGYQASLPIEHQNPHEVAIESFAMA